MNSCEEAELLETVKGVNAIYSKTDARAFVEGMRIEAKAAYHVRIIADQLFKAITCIPTKKISNLPNDIGFHIFATRKLFKGDADKITVVELGQIEDLYYAAYAKVKEHHQEMILRLNNDFAKAEDIYFTHNNPLLPDSGAVTVGAYRLSLEAQNKALRSQSVIGPLEHAVKLKHKYEAMFRQNVNGCVNPGMAITGLEAMAGLRDTTKMSVGMIFGSLAEKYRVAVASNYSDALGLVAHADGKDVVMTPDADTGVHNKASDVQLPSIDTYGEEANADRSVCKCAGDCLCKPLCWIDDGEPCQCNLDSDSALRGQSGYLGPPFRDDEQQSGQTLSIFVFDDADPAQQGKITSTTPCSSDPVQVDKDGSNNHDEIGFAPLGKSSAAKPQAIPLQTLQSKKGSASSKGRQAVEKRDKKVSNSKAKHAELPISIAALEKLKSNGFPMNIKAKGIRGKETHNPLMQKQSKPSKKKVRLSTQTDTISRKVAKIIFDDIGSCQTSDNPGSMQIDPQLAGSERPAVAFNRCMSRKPALTLQNKSDHISQAGEFVNDDASYQHLPAPLLPMENLSIWAPRFPGGGSDAPLFGTQGPVMEDIQTYMDTDGRLVSFNAAPFNSGFRWMQYFNDEVM